MIASKVVKTIMVTSGLVLTLILVLMLGGWLCGVRAYNVMSGSMEPTFMKGSTVMIKDIRDPAQVYALKPGDVIAIESHGRLVTHRLKRLEIDSSKHAAVVTRGDANNVDDDPTSIDKVVGVVVFHTKYVSANTVIVTLLSIFAASSAMLGILSRKGLKQDA